MIHTIENELMSASVSEMGAELQSLKLKATGEEYIWQGDPEIWTGHSPLLFPIVGRLKDDSYIYEGKKYTLGKHGFARKTRFEAKKVNDSHLKMMLKSGEHKDSYPFDFLLEIDFELNGKSIKITHRVNNRDSRPMYFSIGAHPAFNCSVGDYIVFPDDRIAWAHKLNDETKLLSVKRVEKPVKDYHLTITEDIFEHDALIFEGLRSDYVSLFCGGKKRVTVSYGNAPCLGIWSKPGANYVCIEPWYGMDDSPSATGILSGKKQIVKLPPYECFRFPMTIFLY